VSALGTMVAVVWVAICAVASAAVAHSGFAQQLEEDDIAFKGISFAIFFVTTWGCMVCSTVCHTTYCGVFGRWYFKKDCATPLASSLKVALTTSFGSICFGTMLVAAFQSLEQIAKNVRQKAQVNNPALCIIALIIECVIGCIGDILEYFNEWAYVQCAVRGASFIEAAKITYSMMTCSNMQYILSDLLINSVVNFGALLCGLEGAIAGFAAGHAVGGMQVAIFGAAIGWIAGLMAGGTSVGILGSGTKTILALWAEDPEPLEKTHPDVHESFDQTLINKRHEWDPANE